MLLGGRRGQKQANGDVEAVDAAIEAKRRSIESLTAENAKLRLEQEAMSMRASEGEAVGRRPESQDDVEASPMSTKKRRKKKMNASFGGGSKRKFATFYNAASRCALSVGSDGWLRCERDGIEEVDSLSGIFEVRPSSAEPGAIRLTSAATGKVLEMIPPGEDEAWVLAAARDDDEAAKASSRCAFIFEEDGHLRNVATGGLVTVMRLEKPGQPTLTRSKQNRPRTAEVRGHGNKPHQKSPGTPSPFSTFETRWLSDDAVADAKTRQRDFDAAERDRLAKEEEVFSKTQRNAWAETTEKRVIAYGLYGSDPKYTRGAIRNSELVNTIFPGWTARFYCRGDVPPAIIDELRKNGAEIVDMGNGGGGSIAGMFWRFLVADDPTVDRFIVRDSDSRLNPRERAAVDDWITSGKSVHSIRDHPNHDRPLNGGLWGGTKHCVPNIKQKIQQFHNKQTYGGDLVFLNNVVWPLVKDDQISHDAYTCFKYPNSHPFPTKRPPNYQHVGQVFSANDEPRLGDINGFMRGREIPQKCRKHPDWRFG